MSGIEDKTGEYIPKSETGFFDLIGQLENNIDGYRAADRHHSTEAFHASRIKRHDLAQEGDLLMEEITGRISAAIEPLGDDSDTRNLNERIKAVMQMLYEQARKEA